MYLLIFQSNRFGEISNIKQKVHDIPVIYFIFFTFYDNNFIYFQPGNGKVKTKEPKDQISVAKNKLKAIIASL